MVSERELKGPVDVNTVSTPLRERCPLDDRFITQTALPGKALSPGMRSSLEPTDFSPGAAAVREENTK